MTMDSGAATAHRLLTLGEGPGGAEVTANDAFASGSITFVGTATVLIRYGGLTVMTDPNFLHRGDHVHLGYGILSPRLTDPAFDLDQLPPVDLIVLSHLHGDHFDQVVEARLDRRIPIITTHEAARRLRRKGFGAAEGLATWETIVVRKRGVDLAVTAVPARHGPGPIRALLPSVMGSVLAWRTHAAAAQPSLRFYISGDTLLHADLREIPRRFPELDWALLHLGGTRLFGVMLTMDGRQGVEAIRWINPRRVAPIHFDDYPVFKSPLSDFAKEVTAAGLADRVVYLTRGEPYRFEVPRTRWSEAIPSARPP
jgi:L-ascorbate metabolism protein UlaG (beta-lactamase superfamily)